MKTRIALLVILLTATAIVPLHAAEMSGKIGYMSGQLVVQRVDGTIKVMAPKSEVFEGDMLVTAKDSYAQVLMNDGTRMTLRPNSDLKIETYRFRQNAPQADNAIFRLLKGGFRTVTGLIGKRGNPDAYQLRAAAATIGIRGTDFTSRLCTTQNCLEEGDIAQPAKPVVEQAKVAGQLMLIQGEIAAKDTGGKARKLVLGSPVYEGDTLQSSAKSQAVVAFRDGGRITLQENSLFQIEQFKYDKAASQENAVLRLLKGGLRVVTGLIGHVNHDNYRFSVAGATIGIRGTGFDAWCNGPCAEGGKDFGTTLDKPLEGAGVFVWSGEVVLMSPAGSLTIPVNGAAIIERSTGLPVSLTAIPSSVANNPAPRPDSIPVDINKVFGGSPSDGEAGVYVTVHDGHVILARGDGKVDLGRGETGFSNDQLLIRLSTTPAFMTGGRELENIEKDSSSSNPALNKSGCVIGQ